MFQCIFCQFSRKTALQRTYIDFLFSIFDPLLILIRALTYTHIYHFAQLVWPIVISIIWKDCIIDNCIIDCIIDVVVSFNFVKRHKMSRFEASNYNWWNKLFKNKIKQKWWDLDNLWGYKTAESTLWFVVRRIPIAWVLSFCTLTFILMT